MHTLRRVHKSSLARFFRTLALWQFGSLVICLPAAAQDHNHVTVDTFTGDEGPQIVIRAGYIPIESAYSISDGYLMKNGEIAEYAVLDQFVSGAYAGWYGGLDLRLTSDFYFATGRLNGGNFMWELAGIEALAAGPGVCVWGSFETGDFEVSAETGGTTRPDRSYDTGIAGHDHDQAYAFDTPGLYDLTLIAWDSNGIYLDSEPVKVRFRVGEFTIPCIADFNHDTEVDILDFLDFFDAFGRCENQPAPCPDENTNADVNGDTLVDILDFLDFLDAFGIGACP